MKNATVDAIFFDLGMVLVTFDWNIAVPRFGAYGAPEQAVRAFLAHPQHEAFERSELSSDEFFRFGQQMTNFNGTLEEFQDCWNDIFAPLDANIALARTLAAQYPLYVISNTNPWHQAYVEQKYAWLNIFRERYYSPDVQIRKPDTRIYEIALARSGIAATRALFLDDRLENIHGAQAVGMQTLHVPTPDIATHELSKFVAQTLNTQI